jgi:hypothetical protein
MLIRYSTDVKKTSFSCDYYIKLLHSRFQRFDQAPLDHHYDSPSPILQLIYVLSIIMRIMSNNNILLIFPFIADFTVILIVIPKFIKILLPI